MATATIAQAEDLLSRRDAGGVATLTLDNPARRNALSRAMLARLSEVLADIARDRSVKVVVLGAAGPVFSAGHDLKEMTLHRGDADRGRAFYETVMRECAAVMQAIVRLPQPVIARVQGLATAAGCQLVASCDLAIAADDAGFCTPGVNIGLFCSTPMVALSRNVGGKAAMEMLLTGRIVPAGEAVRLGLINRCVPAAELEPAVAELAGSIAAKSGHTVRIGKEAFYRQRELTLAEAYDYAAAVMVENMLARDAEEGIEAFLARREPHWEDR